jgi:hypothetical protein
MYYNGGIITPEKIFMYLEGRGAEPTSRNSGATNSLLFPCLLAKISPAVCKLEPMNNR